MEAVDAGRPGRAAERVALRIGASCDEAVRGGSASRRGTAVRGIGSSQQVVTARPRGALQTTGDASSGLDASEPGFGRQSTPFHSSRNRYPSIQLQARSPAWPSTCFLYGGGQKNPKILGDTPMSPSGFILGGGRSSHVWRLIIVGKIGLDCVSTILSMVLGVKLKDLVLFYSLLEVLSVIVCPMLT